jgi:hypothetical protein
MQQLLCEPEDRIGSQKTISVRRPNSLIVANRKSGFFPDVIGSGSIDGAEHIKVSRILVAHPVSHLIVGTRMVPRN